MLSLLTSDAGSKIGSSVNPITTRGADYAHHITASPSGFENPAAALHKVPNYSVTMKLGELKIAQQQSKNKLTLERLGIYELVR